MNKRNRPIDADDAAMVKKRPRLTSTKTTDPEGHRLSSGPTAGITREVRAEEATSIAETVSAVCRSLVDRVCEVAASQDENIRTADSSKTNTSEAESETAKKSDYVDETILRSYEYYFGED